MSKMVSVFIDGASRGNPGPSGIGVVLKEGEKEVHTLYKFIGEATNNIAEYTAAIHGLQEALRLGYTEVLLRMDSELVAKQLNGEYRVRNENIIPLFRKATELINGFGRVDVRHIGREKNKEADKLANKAINLSTLNKQIG